MNNIKTILKLSMVLAAAGCSASQDNDSPLASADSQVASSAKIPNWGVVEKVRFFRDDRPADGVLQEVILTKNRGGTYDASLRIVTPGFGSPVVDKTEELGEGLRCQNGFADEQGTLTDVMCSRDQRLVDGVLTQLVFTINDADKYDAKKIITLPNFIGTSAPQITEIGTSLALEILTPTAPSQDAGAGQYLLSCAAASPNAPSREVHLFKNAAGYGYATLISGEGQTIDLNVCQKSTSASALPGSISACNNVAFDNRWNVEFIGGISQNSSSGIAAILLHNESEVATLKCVRPDSN